MSAMLGYNSFMLYTEETFEVDDEPFFGYLRGRYTQKELTEIDEYAQKLNIEVIPCVQTLAHLNAITRYKEYSPHIDCNDILLVGDERVYTLIDNIFKTLSKVFSSRRVHIGMDEAHFLGRGKYLDKNGYENSYEIFNKHLSRVCEIAKKYDIMPIMWSDMYWRISYAKTGVFDIPQEVKESAPSIVDVCHWDYYNLDEKHCDHMLEIHNGFKGDLWFAGGSWKWTGFLPANGWSLKTMRVALKSAKKYGVKHIINTTWGDNGGEASIFSVLPSMAFFSLHAMGKSDEEIKREFFALTGVSYDDFMKLEYPNTRAGKVPDERANPTKYMLYSDVFSGFLDPIAGAEGTAQDFADAKEAIEGIGGEYDYIFKTACALCDVMKNKYDLGIRLRSTYKSGDKNKLAPFAEELLSVAKDVEKFIEVFRKQWFEENKTYGFEIQEYRLGGLAQRLKGCALRVEQYCRGDIDEIAELNDELLDNALGRVWADKRFAYMQFINAASVNVF